MNDSRVFGTKLQPDSRNERVKMINIELWFLYTMEIMVIVSRISRQYSTRMICPCLQVFSKVYLNNYFIILN